MSVSFYDHVQLLFPINTPKYRQDLTNNQNSLKIQSHNMSRDYIVQTHSYTITSIPNPHLPCVHHVLLYGQQRLIAHVRVRVRHQFHHALLGANLLHHPVGISGTWLIVRFRFLNELISQSQYNLNILFCVLGPELYILPNIVSRHRQHNGFLRGYKQPSEDPVQ